MLLRRVPDLTSVEKFVAEGWVITSGTGDVGRKAHGMDAVFRSEGEYQKRTLIKICYFQTWKKVLFSSILNIYAVFTFHHYLLTLKAK